MSQSLEICEGLEEWSGNQYLSNCSDTEEEDGNQLVSTRDAIVPKLVVLLFLVILLCFSSLDNGCILSVFLRFSVSQFWGARRCLSHSLKIILIKVADRALSFPCGSGK